MTGTFDGLITRGSSVSLQDQILRALLRRIDDGTFGPGDRLPTERQIAESMGVSLAPVRVALKRLELSGQVERTQGRGTFVLDRPVPYELKLMSSSTESLRRAGVEYSVEVVDQSVSEAPAEAAATLQLEPGRPAFHLQRVVTVRSRPAILLESWVVPEFVGEIVDDAIFDRGESLFALLAKNGVVQHRASGQVSIRFTSETDAELLSMPFGTPLLALSSVTYDTHDRPIDCSLGLYDPARFLLQMDRTLAAGAS